VTISIEATKATAAGSPPPAQKRTGKSWLRKLGPGLITGAADDDPSGIATYSQVGVQFGLSMLWTVLFSFPLMSAIQEICARLGRITGAGLAAAMNERFPKPLVVALVSLLCVANIFNLGADVAAMGAATQLLAGGHPAFYSVTFGAISLLLQVFVPYRKYVKYLKWLTLSLFAYFLTAFFVHVPWTKVLRATFIPSFQWQSGYWTALVAVLGTTISPYLFFWQTSQETEELRAHKSEAPLKLTPWQALRQFRRIATDTRVGMALSNLVAFAIILTTAVTLHDHGNSNTILTAADAAGALRPVAGRFAFALFAVGIIGTGLLAVPVLAGSAGYAVSELFHWRASLRQKAHEAPQFYALISVATAIGVGLNFVGLDPITALYWSAVFNGLAAAPLMVVVMKLSEDRKTVQQFRLPTYLRVLGWLATGVMVTASLFFLYATIFSKK
jgi:NRAMP (natural resistance-associated macrophage protein)-like metal ion transporter